MSGRFKPDMKERISAKAEEMALQRYGLSDDLPSHEQMKVWREAEVDVAEGMMAAAESRMEDRTLPWIQGYPGPGTEAWGLTSSADPGNYSQGPAGS